MTTATGADRTEDETVSCVVRMHDPARVDILSRALRSLAAQDYPNVEPIIVLQGFDADARQAIALAVEDVGWPRSFPPARIINVPVPADGDHRSLLANEGIAARGGRYLAFLDYDDRLYPTCYTTLVNALRRSGAAVAFGGVTLVVADREGGEGAELRRTPVYDGRMKYDVFAENQYPPHSLVLDTRRIRPELLRFDASLSRNEDYVFLLSILAEHDWDTSAADIAVCEYVQWTDRSYSIADMSEPEKEAWSEGNRSVTALREKLSVKLRASDLADIIRAAPLDARILKRAMPRVGNVAPGLLQSTTFWAVESIAPQGDGRSIVRGWIADARKSPVMLAYIYRRRFGILSLIGAGPADISREDVAANLGVSQPNQRYGFEIVCRSKSPLDISELVVGGSGPNGMVVGRRRPSLTQMLMKLVRRGRS